MNLKAALLVEVEVSLLGTTASSLGTIDEAISSIIARILRSNTWRRHVISTGVSGDSTVCLRFLPQVHGYLRSLYALAGIVLAVDWDLADWHFIMCIRLSRNLGAVEGIILPSVVVCVIDIQIQHRSLPGPV